MQLVVADAGVAHDFGRARDWSMRKSALAARRTISKAPAMSEPSARWR
jgi:hypothetical protein